MATASGIWNHTSTSSVPLSTDAASTSSSTANSEAAGISANDFLTLLVSELKNQDPTAQTDPNAYVTQLVQVNSLQQLISINETLNSSLTSSGQRITSAGNPARQLATSDAASTASSASGKTVAVPTTEANVPTTPGNLGVPRQNQAADRLAHALGTRIR